MRSDDIAKHVMKQDCILQFTTTNGSFLKEREDSHDVGIWTRPGLATTLFAPGQDILVSYPGFTDLGNDTLAQHSRQTYTYVSDIHPCTSNVHSWDATIPAFSYRDTTPAVCARRNRYSHL